MPLSLVPALLLARVWVGLALLVHISISNILPWLVRSKVSSVQTSNTNMVSGCCTEHGHPHGLCGSTSHRYQLSLCYRRTPDMALGVSTGLDITMASVGSTGLSDQANPHHHHDSSSPSLYSTQTTLLLFSLIYPQHTCSSY